MRLCWRLAGSVLATASLASASTSEAQTSAWGKMAQEDLAAARALLVENHPGAAAEVGDGVFQGQLRSGYEAASAIGARARTYGDYRAALQRFAASFGDPHIQSSALVQFPRSWPGFMVGLRRDRWVVTSSAAEGAPELGSTLLSCDGRAPDELASERLSPFYANWPVRATKIRASRDLLVDSGNSAQPRIRECTFRLPSGETRTLPLKWERMQPAQPPRQSAAAAQAPAPDVGITEIDGGLWIRLGTSGGRAVSVLEQARLRQDALRAAPFVVLDVRGNDGGASYFTDALAEIIYGASRVAEARRPKGSREPEQIVWRASPGALQTLDAYLPRVTRIASAEHPVVLGIAAQREELARALAADRPIAKAPAQVFPGSGSKPASRQSRLPRVVLVTDRYCFSSCLMGAWLFRALGATHVGEETDANSRYSDLRTVELPSGLSTFATMQSYSTHSPMQFGPYAPTIRFDGDLADDAAVREWVRTRVLAAGR